MKTKTKSKTKRKSKMKKKVKRSEMEGQRWSYAAKSESSWVTDIDVAWLKRHGLRKRGPLNDR